MVILLAMFLLFSYAHSGESYIQTTASDGDVVNCVDKRTQLAFQHHRLKNHKIQELPSEFPTITESYRKSKWRTREARFSTARCPKGMIPVRDGVSSTDRTQLDSASPTSGHEHAIVATKNPSKVYGAKTIINVWNPKIEDGTDEMSISQIWISTGSYAKNNLNTIEVGVQAYPMAYMDNRTRLFIFWTNDTYKSGCYNLECPGFIQTSGSVVLGGSISPFSSIGGRQFEITVLVWKDPKQGNWWLSVGSSVIGYWPAELFTDLADYAYTVEYGGEITNSNISGRHTTTEMGSGRFSDKGVGTTSYFRNMEFVDEDNNLKAAKDLKRKPKDPKYYDVRDAYTDDWGSHIFYGGPKITATHHSGAVSSTSSVVISFFFMILLIM